MKKLKSFLLGTGMLAMTLFSFSCTNLNSGGGTGTVTKDVTQQDTIIKGSDTGDGWAYITYSLSEFSGKEVVIDLSCDMTVTNTGSSAALLQWQVNTSSYPVVAAQSFEPGTNTITVTGKNDPAIKLDGSNMLYLSTYQTTTADLTIEIKNLKYTVTYGGSKEEEKPAKEYPTDIFKIADTKIADFSKERVFDGSQASDITFNSDGTVTYITDGVGSGRGVVFYIKDKDSVINISNYDSIDIELVCSPVTGHWKADAKNPGFGFRLYTPEATGFWSGFEDIDYFGQEADKEYGTFTHHIDISKEWIEKYKDSCDNDDIMGFALKFNAYNTGNDESYQIKVQIKKVQFNKIAGTPEDKKTDDGLKDADRGTVYPIEYPTHDYVSGDTTKYNKKAWVYLPAGYNAEDKDTKYPVFILMHGYGQNQDTWGLTDKGTGGKIKGYMDRGMFSGDVKKFILVVPTGVASKEWSTGAGNDINGFNAFGGELRNDLVPYIKANYNVKEGRDNWAMAGLSMGGGQTFNIGIGECLDMFSYFGAFSAATFIGAAEYIAGVDAKIEFDGLKIHHLYMICGDADSMVYGSFPGYVEAMKAWDRIEEFKSEVYPGGTHDFPVWYRGFKHVIPRLFK